VIQITMSLANKAPTMSVPTARLAGIQRNISRKEIVNDKQKLRIMQYTYAGE